MSAKLDNCCGTCSTVEEKKATLLYRGCSQAQEGGALAVYRGGAIILEDVTIVSCTADAVC
eukprot:4320758-Pleurochrysis_carterae.AAC.2